jgi:hypothetical protein
MDLEMGTAQAGIEWRISETPVDYLAAIEEMESRVAAIRAGAAAELVWLLDHPALYTAGTSARDNELLEPGRLPVFRTGRGGRYTYHGPGQRIAYVGACQSSGRDAEVGIPITVLDSASPMSCSICIGEGRMCAATFTS